jgi:leucyl-tRNA synthetase
MLGLRKRSADNGVEVPVLWEKNGADDARMHWMRQGSLDHRIEVSALRPADGL